MRKRFKFSLKKKRKEHVFNLRKRGRNIQKTHFFYDTKLWQSLQNIKTDTALVWAKNPDLENCPLNTWPLRHGSRINTNRFPKQERKAQAFKAFWGHAPQGNFWIFSLASQLRKIVLLLLLLLALLFLLLFSLFFLFLLLLSSSSLLLLLFLTRCLLRKI